MARKKKVCEKELSGGTESTPATVASLGSPCAREATGQASTELLPAAPEESLPAMRELCLDMEPLRRIASGKVVRVPRNPHFTRKDVVHAFQAAFELIGGIPRLALWADENESDFYKLYARLLPSQASSALGESRDMRILMAIRPSALDVE